MTQAQAVLNTGFTTHLAVHGETATYTPAGGTAATIQVIFDEAAEVADPQTGILTTAPQARAWTSDVLTPNKGRMAVRGVTYNILAARVDGLEVTHMVLSRDTIIPVAPSGLSAVMEVGDPRLNWTRNATTNTAVEVWRNNFGGSWALVATLGAAIVTYLDTSAPGLVLDYKVRNTNQGGPSPFSNTVQIDAT